MDSPSMDVRAFVDGRQVVRFTMGPGVHTLGRAPSCDIVLEADGVSRQHARFTLNESSVLFLEDLGSSNGTFLDEKPIVSATPVDIRQSIRIGSVQVLVQRSPEARPPGDDLGKAERYEIGAEIAKGGMGAILAARQPAIQREVAMKVMLRAESAAERRRFINEARVTGQLEHPNIVPVHELSVDEDGHPYYTMKMVRGVTLKHVLADVERAQDATLARYPLAALLTIFQKVCDGIAFAHSRGILHRDLKPDNIMIGDFGEVLVMDWGLAKLFTDRRSTPTSPPADAAGDSVSPHLDELDPGDAEFFGRTLVGTVMGTPAYMSPEQARGEVDELDARSDLYALGAILFQILHLRPPYSGRNANEIVEKVQAGKVEWESNKAAREEDLRASLPHLPGGRIPDSLAAVVRKAMSFHRRERYPDVASLQLDLQAFQNGFATSAEKATFGRQFSLAIKRHKAVAAAVGTSLVLLIVVSIAFTTRVVHERNRAIAERQRAEDENSRALKALAEVEKERNRAQQALAETQTERARAEAERTRAETALSVAEDQRNRARQALADAEAERLRANTEQTRAEKERMAAQAEREKAATESTRAQTAMSSAEAESARAEKAVANLKNTAPDIFLSARAALENGKIDEAATKVSQAIRIDGQNAEYRLFYAELCQAMGRIESAIAEYRSLLELQPAHSTARASLALCEKLLKANGGPSPLRKELQQELVAALLDQKRGVEANALAAGLAGPLVVVTRANIRRQLGTFASQGPWNDERLSPLPDGSFALNLDGLTMASLDALSDQPIGELSVVGTKLTKSIPSGTSLISPLAGSLRKLTVSPSAIFWTNLAALQVTDYTVKSERGYGTVANLRMLSNQPLQRLCLDELLLTELKDRGNRAWDPIEKKPITHLSLNRLSPLRDLTPFGHLPLEYLDVSNTLVFDLGALRECPTLRTLLISRCPVAQLDPLAKLQLTRLMASDCPKIRDVAALRGQPLKSVSLDGTGVIDLDPLLENPALEELVLPPILVARIPKHTIQALMRLPNLRRISFKKDLAGRPDQTAEQFWAEVNKP